MQVDIIPIGNSKGIRIPKALLEECGMSGRVELTIKNKSLLLKPINDKAKPALKPRKKNPREGWAEDAKRMAANGDDAMAERHPHGSPPPRRRREGWDEAFKRMAELGEDVYIDGPPTTFDKEEWEW